MTVDEVKKAYIEYLRRRQTPDHEDVPTEVIVCAQDKQDKK